MKKPEPKPALLSGVEWLTLPEALRRVESETGEALSEGLLLQRVGGGAIRLALRLDHAKGTPWSEEAPIQNWWRVHFTESSTFRDVVTLSGVFDLDLDEGGRHVIDMMRRRANGDARPVSRATLLEPRVKLIDDSGASFALLCPATTQDGDGGTVISGTYCYASGLTWPAQFAGAELVVRSDELARITGVVLGAVSSARVKSHSAGAEPEHACAVTAPTEPVAPDKALPWWQVQLHVGKCAVTASQCAVPPQRGTASRPQRRTRVGVPPDYGNLRGWAHPRRSAWALRRARQASIDAAPALRVE